MRTRSIAVLALALGATGASCRAIVGLDHYHFGQGGQATCVCAAAVPAGWIGPLALVQGPADTELVCPESYPDAELRGGSDPHGAPAACDACKCASTPATCSPVIIKTYTDWGCQSGSATMTVTPYTCTAVDDSVRSVRPNEDAKPIGPCTPSGGAAHVPPVTWTKALLACGGSKPTGDCVDGTCVPTVDGSGPCVGRAGEQLCPAAYPERHTLDVVTDDRGCSPCGCGAAWYPCSVTVYKFESSQQCQDQPHKLEDGDCTKAKNVTLLVHADADCATSGGDPVGGISSTGWTVCCAPDNGGL